MTPGEATQQARFLARCAREYGSTWPRRSSQRYAGQLLVRTAYSSYQVIDGRCIVVRRAGAPREDDEHECLGTYLIGYLVRHDDPEGARWSLHESPRMRAKAVFWRPTRDGSGHFVVTSRLADDVVPERAARAPQPASIRVSPPPLPARAAKNDSWLSTTPTAGVEVPLAAGAAKPPHRTAPPLRAHGRARNAATPPPPPAPRCMKRRVDP